MNSIYKITDIKGHLGKMVKTYSYLPPLDGAQASIWPTHCLHFTISTLTETDLRLR
jgi:hypothetical protein